MSAIIPKESVPSIDGSAMAEPSPLLDIGTAKALARVRIDGVDYAVKAPRVRQYAEFLELMRAVKDASPDEKSGKSGDPGKQVAAVIGVLRLSLPDVPSTVLDELEIDVANRLIEAVEKTINTWVERRERELERSPRSGEPSRSPGSGASPLNRSLKAIRGR